MKMVRYENTVSASIKFNGTHIKPNFGFAPTVSTWRLLQFINRAPENLTFFLLCKEDQWASLEMNLFVSRSFGLP